MRILMAAALGLAVAMATVSPVVAATTKEEQTILLKKKKALAAKLAAEKDLREAEADAAKLRTNKALLAKKQRRLQVQPASSTSFARKKDCKGFMDCLFGKRSARLTRRVGVQSAAFSAGAGLSNRQTRETVSWSESKYPRGSLIVRTQERALYYVLGDGEAIRYSVGVGRDGMQWSGSSTIGRKAEWPSWSPPQIMIEREAAKGHYIPDFMEGGPENPLGARALYINNTIFRVHGTNNEASIGGAVSSGCIRMMNADVIDLYERVKIGARIYVYQ